MIEILRGVFAVAFIFSFAIFIHELGHFMFAKLFGVKVETFSIGFGKKLLRWQRGETEYCLSAVPFGGYVKMVGIHSKEMEKIIEGDKPASPEEKNDAKAAAVELAAPAPVTLGQGIVNEVDALRSKPWWQKFLVFSAGCFNNFLTAAVVFFLMDWIGHYKPEPVPALVSSVRYVDPDRVPLRAGDRVVSVAGTPVQSLLEFGDEYLKIAEQRPSGASVPLQVLREGTTISVELPLDPPTSVTLPAGEIISFAGEESSTRHAQRRAQTLLSKNNFESVPVVVQDEHGAKQKVLAPPVAVLREEWPFSVFSWKTPAFIASALPNLPAERAGLKFGDEILAVNGIPVNSATEATDVIRNHVGETIPFQVRRGDDKRGYETLTLNVEVRPDPEDPSRGQIGIVFGDGPLRNFVKKPFGRALVDGFLQTGLLAVRYLTGIWDILQSSFQTIRENVGGPLAIGTQAVKAMQLGWSHYFWLFAVFNVVLAVTNLLPLPVFDGGHILFSSIEAIIRRPLPARFMLWVYNIFTVLIIFLALAITFNDVIMNLWRLFS